MPAIGFPAATSRTSVIVAVISTTVETSYLGSGGVGSEVAPAKEKEDVIRVSARAGEYRNRFFMEVSPGPDEALDGPCGSVTFGKGCTLISNEDVVEILLRLQLHSE